MSQRVLPVLAAIDLSDPRPVHLVLPGTTVCAICGQSMFQMRFHYLEDAEIFTVVEAQHGDDAEPVGLWSPADEMIVAYKPCRHPDTPQISVVTRGFDGLSH